MELLRNCQAYWGHWLLMMNWTRNLSTTATLLVTQRINTSILFGAFQKDLHMRCQRMFFMKKVELRRNFIRLENGIELQGRCVLEQKELNVVSVDSILKQLMGK